IMLDAACPTRLFAALPPGAEVMRMGLAEAVELTQSFLSLSSSSGERSETGGPSGAEGEA
ncbi:hypothetical protein, partial [Brevundimonas sp.]|uniref:hypothetical protein n=1 Tax=Brevundimonas sp. TaxID=1871086 RepID=UPI0025C5F047